MRLFLRLAILALISGLTLVACASTSPAASGATSAPAASAPATSVAVAAKSAAVTIKGFAFSPAALNVGAGTTVTFTNNDSTTHTITSGANRAKDGKFDQQLSGGTEATVTFDSPGTYEYFCSFHSSMKATVVVK